jgi:putative colanic acid biosynthesis glycosyltransferase WcaI
MRFLVLTQYFPPEVGASPVRLLSLCRELARSGHSVEVVTAMPNHPKGRIFPEYRGRFYLRVREEWGVVHRVWLYAANKTNRQRLLNYFSFVATSLFGLARASRPDFVFVDSPPLFLGISGWIAAKWWKAPLVFNVADLWPDSVCDLGVMRDGSLMRMAYALEEWIYRHARYVTASSEGQRNALVKNKHLSPGKVLFLPNGVDNVLFQPRRPDTELKARLGLEGKRVILYAGNHGYAGAVEQIISAAQLLRSEPSIHFLFVGDGPEKQRLKAMAAGSHLTNITFHDAVPIEALPSIISFCDVAVVSLRNARILEGVRSAKLFVMMAAGKPIVMAGRGETAHFVEAAEAGIVVPPEDPPALATAIRTVLDHPAEAAAMGRNGRAFVVRHLEWSTLVRNWLSQLSGSVIPVISFPEERTA